MTLIQFNKGVGKPWGPAAERNICSGRGGKQAGLAYFNGPHPVANRANIKHEQREHRPKFEPVIPMIDDQVGAIRAVLR